MFTHMTDLVTSVHRARADRFTSQAAVRRRRPGHPARSRPAAVLVESREPAGASVVLTPDGVTRVDSADATTGAEQVAPAESLCR